MKEKESKEKSPKENEPKIENNSKLKEKENKKSKKEENEEMYYNNEEEDDINEIFKPKNLKIPLDEDEENDSLIFNSPKEEDTSLLHYKKFHPTSLSSFSECEIIPLFGLSKKHKRTNFDIMDTIFEGGGGVGGYISPDNNFSKKNIIKYSNSLEQIKKLSSLQKSYIQSLKENFDKEFSILQNDFELLQDYEKEIFKDTSIDLMFIMDLTGSMGLWLNEARKNVRLIVEEISDNNPGAKIRLSFIGYRDFNDAKEQRNYDTIEFSEDINKFDDFLGGLDCYGGGDEPEDVVGGMDQALKMDWVSNAKYAVLVCDGPCHGKKYHNVLYDKFEEGDPSGLVLEEIIKKFKEKGITLYCIEVNNTTYKMFDIMKTVYNDENLFHVEKMGNDVHQFSFFVAFSASKLLGNSKYSKYKFKDVLTDYRNKMIDKITEKYFLKNNENNNFNFNGNNSNNEENILELINNIDNLDLEGNDKKLFDFINRMSDLSLSNKNSNSKSNEKENKNNTKMNNEKMNEITITNNKDKDINKEKDNIPILFDQFNNSNNPLNGIRIDFILKALTYEKSQNSLTNWTNPIIKEQNFKTQLMFFFSSMKKNDLSSSYELHSYDYNLDKNFLGIIPYFFSKEEYSNPSLLLNKTCKEELICQQIADYFNIRIHDEFPQLKQYFKFNRHIIYEMDKNSENNLKQKGFKNFSRLVLSEISDPFNFTLSSPIGNQILNVFSHFSYQVTSGQLLITNLKYNEEKKIITDYKIYWIKNKEYKNILEFFSYHICDNYCKSLGLAHPRKKIKNNINVSEKFFAEKYYTNSTLCNCCSLPIMNKKESCSICSNKIGQKFNRCICSSCHFPFEFSIYYYNCQLLNYPKMCLKCNNNF